MTHFAALIEIRSLRKEIQQLRRQVLAARRSRDRWKSKATEETWKSRALRRRVEWLIAHPVSRIPEGAPPMHRRKGAK